MSTILAKASPQTPLGKLTEFPSPLAKVQNPISKGRGRKVQRRMKRREEWKERNGERKEVKRKLKGMGGKGKKGKGGKRKEPLTSFRLSHPHFRFLETCL